MEINYRVIITVISSHKEEGSFVAPRYTRNNYYCNHLPHISPGSAFGLTTPSLTAIYNTLNPLEPISYYTMIYSVCQEKSYIVPKINYYT